MRTWKHTPDVAETDLDWVLVGRLTGQLVGPVDRRPTVAELRAAHAGGASINVLARQVGVAFTTMADWLGVMPR